MRLLLGAALLLLGACSTAADLTGLAVGGTAGGLTANPAVGYAVGIGTRAAADYAFKYVARTRQRGEQDAIATVAGPLPEGGSAAWRIRHDIPIGNEGGTVRVVRAIDTSLVACREIAFSIHDDEAPEAWFVTTICRNGERWKWAAAEPAVERWGFLQ